MRVFTLVELPEQASPELISRHLKTKALRRSSFIAVVLFTGNISEISFSAFSYLQAFPTITVLLGELLRSGCNNFTHFHTQKTQEDKCEDKHHLAPHDYR